jgi:SAM-dependent methyltransferase
MLHFTGGVMPFESNSFDGALCIEVLEHASSPELLLSEVNRIIKPGSRLLLTVPWSARRHHIPYDYHRFTRERLEILLVNSGFDSIQIRERGDDYSVIANKLIVVIIRNLKRISVRNFIIQLPLLVLLTPLSVLVLCAAHLSFIFGNGQSEDPLGYAVVATKTTPSTPICS